MPAREIDQDLSTLTGTHSQRFECDRPGKIPAIGRDEMHRAGVAQAQRINAGIGSVNNPQPDNSLRYMRRRSNLAVDQDRVSGHAMHDVHHRIRIGQPPVTGKSAILNDQCEIVRAIGFWQSTLRIVAINDVDHSGQPGIDILCRSPVNVCVKEGRARRLVDLHIRRPVGTWADRQMRTAIVFARYEQSMPVGTDRP